MAAASGLWNLDLIVERVLLSRLGCTLLVRIMEKESVKGSIQIEVPVKPVWPYEPSGKISPRNEVEIYQP